VPEQRHILIADDERLITAALEAYFEADGYRVTTAADADEALAAAAQSPPDLVILDFVMPGMDGAAACRALKQREGMAAVPVIMFTGRSEEEAVLDARDAGADWYVTKPFDLAQLGTVVRQLLEQRQD